MTAPHLLPDKAKVNAIDYKVVPMVEDVENNFGLCDTATQTIFLDPEMSNQRAVEIIFHEFFHAIWEERGIGYSDRQQENVVRHLSSGLAALYRDNPSLARRILELSLERNVVVQ